MTDTFLWENEKAVKFGKDREPDRIEKLALEASERQDEALRQRAIDHRLEVEEAREQAKDKKGFDGRLRKYGGTLGAPGSYQRALVTGGACNLGKDKGDLW